MGLCDTGGDLEFTVKVWERKLIYDLLPKDAPKRTNIYPVSKSKTHTCNNETRREHTARFINNQLTCVTILATLSFSNFLTFCNREGAIHFYRYVKNKKYLLKNTLKIT